MDDGGINGVDLGISYDSKHHDILEFPMFKAILELNGFEH